MKTKLNVVNVALSDLIDSEFEMPYRTKTAHNRQRERDYNRSKEVTRVYTRPIVRSN